MKIEHTTYDQTHSCSSSLKPKQAVSRSRLKERPVTKWPGEWPSPLVPPKIWGQRAKIDENINKAAEGYLEEVPTLRRKAKFENIKDVFIRKPGRARGKKTTEQYADLRAAIKEGKLERIVPPRAVQEQEGWREGSASTPNPGRSERKYTSRASNSSNNYSPDRPAISRNRHRPSTSQSDSPSREPSRTKKPRSPSSSRIKEYISAGVDVLDEKREQIQTPQRRPSGEGGDPWAPNTYLGHCRICRKPMVASIRGLCGQCEGDYTRPKSPKREMEVEIKPIPPLKDRRYSPPRKEKAIPWSRFSFEDDDEDEDTKPPVPPKDDERIRLGDLSAKGKMILQPVAFKQSSFKVDIEDVTDEDDDRYTRWQKDLVRPEATKTTQKRTQNWSGRSFSEQDDHAPLIPKRENCERNLRDTEFYGFYNKVLEGYSGSSDGRHGRSAR